MMVLGIIRRSIISAFNSFQDASALIFYNATWVTTQLSIPSRMLRKRHKCFRLLSATVFQFLLGCFFINPFGLYWKIVLSIPSRMLPINRQRSKPRQTHYLSIPSRMLLLLSPQKGEYTIGKCFQFLLGCFSLFKQPLASITYTLSIPSRMLLSRKRGGIPSNSHILFLSFNSFQDASYERKWYYR